MRNLRKYIKTLLREYISRQDLEDVKQTAQLIHMGQKRRSDQSDYFTHPLEVYNITRRFYPQNHGAQLLALLHDTLEDADKAGNVSKQEAHDMIQSSIHDRSILEKINVALQILTHDKSIPYPDYLQDVFENPLAGIVKVSDLIHNLSHNPSPRQIAKYTIALRHIRVPGYIKTPHLDALMQQLEIKQ